MKKILITGANSYIGTSFEKYMQQFEEEYQIDTISLKDESWKVKDFSKYDSLIHLAAIVHRKETNEKIYYDVNRDLAKEVAEKSKKEGIQQFIFFSTMAVFGVEHGIITNETPLTPKNAYGKSKLEAEKLINNLRNNDFKVVIIRPPMVYGKGCTGNYIKLSAFAKRSKIFPKINNKRSMIYINNLMFFLKLLIDESLDGTFHPQNSEYMNTSQLVKLIAEQHHRRVKLTSFFNFPIQLSIGISSTINKVFGNLIYSQEMSGFPDSIHHNIKLDYSKTELFLSIKETES